MTIFSFLQHYNEFLSPLLYLNTVERFPMALGMRMFQGAYGPDWPLIMAASALFIFPTIFVFLVAQRYFIQGIHLDWIGWAVNRQTLHYTQTLGKFHYAYTRC